MNSRNFFSHRYQFNRVRVGLIKGTLTLIALDLLVILLPWLVKAVIDRLNGENSAVWIPEFILNLSTPFFILVICSLYLSVSATIAYLRYWWRVYIIWSSFPVAHDSRMSLFRQLHSFDREFFKKEKVGDLLSSLTTDTENLRMTISIGALMFIDATINFILFPIFMYQLDPALTLYIVPVLISMTIGAFLISNRTSKLYDEVQNATASLSSRTFEIFSAIRLIKAFRKEEFIFNKFEEDGERLRRASLKVAKFESFFAPALEGVLGISLAFVLIYGGFQYFRGEVELSNLVAFQIYLGHLDWPMMAYGWFIQLSRKSTASAKRIQNLLKYKNPLQVFNAQSFKEYSFKKFISFHNVIFSFSDGRPFKLGPLNFDIERGAWIGISGPLGGGKSTFLELLSRQRDPSEGQIFLGGKDLRSLSLEDVASKIVYVPQEAFMFSRSIRSNLQLGNSKVSDDELYSLLKDLAFDRDLIDSRGGLSARLGERGVDLSGGQKQRLALGRALVMKREVYLFDDVFSHVDIETEHRLLQMLRKYLPKDATVFFISQRFQTLQFCDSNLILNNGHLEFIGSAKESLEKSSFLRDIANI